LLLFINKYKNNFLLSDGGFLYLHNNSNCYEYEQFHGYKLKKKTSSFTFKNEIHNYILQRMLGQKLSNVFSFDEEQKNRSLGDLINFNLINTGEKLEGFFQKSNNFRNMFEKNKLNFNYLMNETEPDLN